MSGIRQWLWVVALIYGVAMVGVGIFFITKGVEARDLITAGLQEEQIKTGKDGVQFGVPEGTLVIDAKSAQAQADTIKLHSTAIKGEVLKAGVPATLHYAEMKKELFVSPEAYTNARNTYLNGVTLRTALSLAVMGYGIADMAIGMGIVVILLGMASMVVAAPALFWAREAEGEVVKQVSRQIGGGGPRAVTERA